ncbi:Uncharacterized protein SCF082_LOCUS30117 [Durusdinium trenchii]|uniref:Uncharacterized protein n=1 Tax=Durusdinium trenchii TaxID=1381693 RepID=A0ABP0MXA2_9DINO
MSIVIDYFPVQLSLPKKVIIRNRRLNIVYYLAHIPIAIYAVVFFFLNMAYTDEIPNNPFTLIILNPVDGTPFIGYQLQNDPAEQVRNYCNDGDAGTYVANCSDPADDELCQTMFGSLLDSPFEIFVNFHCSYMCEKARDEKCFLPPLALITKGSQEVDFIIGETSASTGRRLWSIHEEDYWNAVERGLGALGDGGDGPVGDGGAGGDGAVGDGGTGGDGAVGDGGTGGDGAVGDGGTGDGAAGGGDGAVGDGGDGAVGDGSGQAGDGMGDGQAGDGMGDGQAGDGMGDGQAGDGMGDGQAGDGMGDGQAGDGMGDGQAGDGMGDGQAGDGMGDGQAGDGDGSSGQPPTGVEYEGLCDGSCSPPDRTGVDFNAVLSRPLEHRTNPMIRDAILSFKYSFALAQPAPYLLGLEQDGARQTNHHAMTVLVDSQDIVLKQWQPGEIINVTVSEIVEAAGAVWNFTMISQGSEFIVTTNCFTASQDLPPTLYWANVPQTIPRDDQPLCLIRFTWLQDQSVTYNAGFTRSVHIRVLAQQGSSFSRLPSIQLTLLMLVLMGIPPAFAGFVARIMLGSLSKIYRQATQEAVRARRRSRRASRAAEGALVFMPGLLWVRSTPGTAGEAVVTTPPQYFDLPMQLATAGLKAIANVATFGSLASSTLTKEELRNCLKEVLFTSRQHLADKDLDRLTNFVFEKDPRYPNGPRRSADANPRKSLWNNEEEHGEPRVDAGRFALSSSFRDPITVQDIGVVFDTHRDRNILERFFTPAAIGKALKDQRSLELPTWKKELLGVPEEKHTEEILGEEAEVIHVQSGSTNMEASPRAGSSRDMKMHETSCASLLAAPTTTPATPTSKQEMISEEAPSVQDLFRRVGDLEARSE